MSYINNSPKQWPNKLWAIFLQTGMQAEANMGKRDYQLLPAIYHGLQTSGDRRCVSWYILRCVNATLKNIFNYLAECSFPSVLFQEYESLETSNKDLAALLQGSVKCQKEKPPSTKETKKEAFDRYMKIIYRLPPSIKVSSLLASFQYAVIVGRCA